MHWWRSDDWQDVIAGVSDPAVARLALTAAAGHSIGFEALAQAAEDPAVVYAYNRAGADDRYASDVVAALDVYDRTTTALMVAGMPESIAASRAALVFGIPMVDNQYLEVAKQPVMPSDMLVASADEALARAFSYLVPDEVIKADEPWDESQVNRDEIGRFAPEGKGAQQTYRVVGGKKVAIATQVQTSEQAKRKADEVKATSTDEQMLAELARQNEEQKKYAAAKRAKRLKRLNRVRGVQAQQRQAREAREVAQAQEQRATAQQATQEQKKTTSKAKVLENRQLLRGLTSEQKAARLLEQRKERLRVTRAEQMEYAEKLQAVSNKKSGPFFDLDSWHPWEEEGTSPDDITTAGAAEEHAPEVGVFKPPDTQSTYTNNDPHFLVLVRRDNREVIDGANLVHQLLVARINILNGISMPLTDDERTHSLVLNDMATLIDRVENPPGYPQRIPVNALVWVSKDTYASVADLMTAVHESTDYTGDGAFKDPTFTVQVYDRDTGQFNEELRTIIMPGYSNPQPGQFMNIGKADEFWDESQVNRDAIGRFAPEGHRERVIGGRRMLVKVEQGAQKVESKKEIERTSTDTQDLEWVAQRNRAAAQRRRRLARVKQAQAKRQQVAPAAQAQTAVAQVKSERTQGKKKLRVLENRQLLRGLTQEQKIERQRIQMQREVQQLKDEGKIQESAPMDPKVGVLNPYGPIGRVLDDFRERLVSGEHDPNTHEFILRIAPGEVEFAEQLVNILRHDPVIELSEPEGSESEMFDPEDPLDNVFLEVGSTHDLFARTSVPHGPIEYKVFGGGTDGDEFRLEYQEVPSDAKNTTDSTQIRTVRLP